ncbi:hypothetical protein TUBRATIS_23750 [Tubulinosema ratisbonensis]|uniref:Uncharacterized protein n=1 Tax=Tubulinosema ratisbonensis TaxID=291195 RepID=A0A437AJ96_9MICR|nr:hypothetical protein TUBRATIS_23750 [Tubulinosema ratisbonensis]
MIKRILVNLCLVYSIQFKNDLKKDTKIVTISLKNTPLQSEELPQRNPQTLLPMYYNDPVYKPTTYPIEYLKTTSQKYFPENMSKFACTKPYYMIGIISVTLLIMVGCIVVLKIKFF